MGKKLNYTETFMFPDIPLQVYPVYAVSESGKMVNFKSMAYPNPRSRKRFTRRKQLLLRSLQAKIFDTLINIGYWDPLPVIREFPIVIQNSQRLPGQKGLFYYLDYYFPTLDLAVELDSELHDGDNDEIRDKYLKEVLGITTFRILDFHKPRTQETKFKELCKKMREMTPREEIRVFDFSHDIKGKPYLCETNKD